MTGSKGTITTKNITSDSNQATSNNNTVPAEVEETLQEAGLDFIKTKDSPNRPPKKGEYTEELDNILG